VISERLDHGKQFLVIDETAMMLQFVSINGATKLLGLGRQVCIRVPELPPLPASWGGTISIFSAVDEHGRVARGIAESLGRVGN
jgi:hypothetical protein